MYSISEIEQKLEMARRLDLRGWQYLTDYDMVRRCCNGIGAAWFPWWLRGMISFFCPDLLIAADIHDIQYEIGGSESDRVFADAAFLTNVELLALQHWWLRRWLDRRLGLKMYRLLRLGGGLAWHYTGDQEDGDSK